MERMPKITQAMIDAYDEYTHLTLDRRRLMKRLTILTGSGAAAAAILPMIAASRVSAQLVAENDPRLTMREGSFAAPGGGEISYYLARPAEAEGDLPGVLVIHENRGLNPHIRDVARRVALEGFIALAADFLSPQGGTPEDEDQAREMIGALDSGETTSNAIAAVSHIAQLEGSNGNVGAVGFCWGGGLVNALAVAAPPQLRAAVAYYGRQPPASDVARIKAALMLHYAGLDERINAGIPEYEAALKEHGKQYTIHMYEGVNHAFNNDTSQARYDQAAAELAWQRTISFFKEKLA